MARNRTEPLPEKRGGQRTGGSEAPAGARTANPLSALENLHFDLGRLESLAFAAHESLARVPRASTPEGRHGMRRLDHFVTLVAEEAAAMLDAAGRALEEISEQG